jgi:Ohr subfamily peroxiredoxin
MKLEKTVYQANAKATGGRDGTVRTSDGSFELKLALPKEMGGNGQGANPEQLFAAGYSACFIGATKLVASQSKITLPSDFSITGLVSIGPIASGGFGLAVELQISLPGMDRSAAMALIEKAHQVCPYSNATRGNIEVKLTLV